MDDSSPASLKQCFKCKQFFPATLDFFYAKTRNKDHLRESCKKCSGGLIMGVPRLPKGYKSCPRCKQVFPRTTEYFFANTGARGGGIGAYCKSCTHEMYVEKCKADEHASDRRPEALVCGRCGIAKPATEQFFQRSPLCRYGLHTICKTCKNARRYEHYHQDPEKARTRQRKYAAQKSLKDRHKYQLHGEEIRAYRRALYARNPQRFKENQHRYNHSQHGLEVLRVRGQRRRARKAQVKGTHTPTQIREQLKRQHYCCYYAACGFAKFKRIKENGEWKYLYEIEHTYPLSRVAGTDIPANDISYLVLACESCNGKKHDRFPWEFPEGGRLL